MKQIKKLVLVAAFASLGSVVYGMEKEQSLPSETKETVSASIYTFLKRVKVGTDVYAHEFSAALSPDGKTIFTTSGTNEAILWNVDSGKQIQTIKEGEKGLPTGSIQSGAFSPDGKTLLTGTAGYLRGRYNTARLWDVHTGKQLQEFKGHIAVITSVAFSPDGKIVLTGSWDTTARLWDVETGKQLKEFNAPERGYEREITSVAFSPDGKIVATGSLDGRARLWDVETGKLLASTTYLSVGSTLEEYKKSEGHSGGGVLSVAFSPDGKTLLTGGMDSTARLWDVGTGKQLKKFKGHTSPVDSVAFNPDGKTILTGANFKDATARLWDIKSGEQLQVFKDQTYDVTSVAFSKDGEIMIIGSKDSAVTVYKRS